MYMYMYMYRIFVCFLSPLDGSAVTYLHWAYKEPRLNTNSKLCVELQRSRDYQAALESCDRNNQVVCHTGQSARVHQLLVARSDGGQFFIATSGSTSVA